MITVKKEILVNLAIAEFRTRVEEDYEVVVNDFSLLLNIVDALFIHESEEFKNMDEVEDYVKDVIYSIDIRDTCIINYIIN